MCITFFAIKPNNFIKFFLVFNREEFFNRETTSMGLNYEKDEEFKNKLFFPLDTLSQGTFLCINIENANFCALLNNNFINNPYNVNLTAKRGEIPLNFCKITTEQEKYEEYLKYLEENKNSYNGYNLVCGNMKSEDAFYFTNNTEYLTNNNLENENLENNNLDNVDFDFEMPAKFTEKEIHGVSNFYYTKESAKIEHGKEKIKNILMSVNDENEFVEELFKVMEDDTKFVNIDFAKDNNFEKNILVNKELKSYLASSIYFNDKINDAYIQYGTRHTICLILDYENNLNIYEYVDDIVHHTDSNTNDKYMFVENRDYSKVKKYSFQL
jgi:uncharacterized protein with NRDE domain